MPQTSQVCPSPAELDLLELVRCGAYRPSSDRPVGLCLPPLHLHGSTATVELVDPEGAPLTTLPIEVVDGQQHAMLGSTPSWQGVLSTRPFESLYVPPAEVRAVVAAGAVVLMVDRPITKADLCKAPTGRPIVLLVLAGPSTAPSARVVQTLRRVRQLSADRHDIQAVAIPLNADSSMTDPALYEAVLTAYAPRGVVSLAKAHTSEPPARSGGFVLFFTGLSGSGKSTIARAMRNAILEQHGRPVTLLDGDVVRRTLSAGLGFTPTERDVNVQRIGWVAAQIAQHGGIAICSPIAPDDSTRRYVRRVVAEGGGDFVMIHVSTPLEVCERRDRKGLYAKARVGLVADFTGVSAPYDEPTDADLVLDTSTMDIAEAQHRVEHLLVRRNLLNRP